MDIRTATEKEADEWKLKGNELYKAKQFAEAIEMYDKAIATEPNEMTYISNKAAVYIEMGEWEKCIQLCQATLEKRYDMSSAKSNGASFEKCAKLFCRMGVCFGKQGQYEQGLAMYGKALTEDNNRFTRTALRDMEREKEKFEKESYMDATKAAEHKDKGNDFFRNKQWVEAKAEYDEAVKRAPDDAKIYSNRAAALIQLVALPDALRDLEKAISIDPTFVRAYARKGQVQFMMKDFNKSLETYAKGLELDPQNQDLLRGRQQVLARVQENSSSKEVDEEQIKRSMADPEIQRIVSDPQIQMILKQMQENPAVAQEALQDPKIREAVSKLAAAGIVRLG